MSDLTIPAALVGNELAPLHTTAHEEEDSLTMQLSWQVPLQTYVHQRVSTGSALRKSVTLNWFGNEAARSLVRRGKVTEPPQFECLKPDRARRCGKCRPCKASTSLRRLKHSEADAAIGLDELEEAANDIGGSLMANLFKAHIEVTASGRLKIGNESITASDLARGCPARTFREVRVCAFYEVLHHHHIYNATCNIECELPALTCMLLRHWTGQRCSPAHTHA